jgi:hypothetical protein
MENFAMVVKILTTAGAAVFIFASADFAAARTAHQVDARGFYGRFYNDGVHYNPLIPLKPEVPPLVDPNEKASGSYGAMFEGRNPAPGPN